MAKVRKGGAKIHVKKCFLCQIYKAKHIKTSCLLQPLGVLIPNVNPLIWILP